MIYFSLYLTPFIVIFIGFYIGFTYWIYILDLCRLGFYGGGICPYSDNFVTFITYHEYYKTADRGIGCLS